MKPRIASVMPKIRYWNMVDSKDRNASWQFDFIGIHKLCFSGKFSFTAPSFLCKDNRPKWENEVFDTKKEAIAFAKNIAKEHSIFIVDCTESKQI